MNTFDTIIYKVINIKNNVFSPKYDTTDMVSGIHKLFFSRYIEKKTTYKNKFNFLNETIDNFYFVKKHEERNEFINYFNKIQKVYHTLNRFCFLYKIKKAKLIVNTDLQLNEIKFGEKNVLSIYYNNYNYLFKIEDLLKIIYISLTNTYLFFCQPITIKNPYNNLPFQKSILYYIYFYLINNTSIGYIKPEYIDIFFKFKQTDFNMTTFINSYEYILREISIKNYINNSTKTQTEGTILIMISEYNIRHKNYKINIDIEFPVDILIKIMTPYLNLYLTAYYSLVTKHNIDSKIKLYKKLKEFNKFNPLFGRKIVVFKEKIKNGKIIKYDPQIEFNSLHKKFNTYTTETFINNHLLYNEPINEPINDDIFFNLFNFVV